MKKPEKIIIKPSDIDVTMVREIDEAIPGFAELFSADSLNRFNKDQEFLLSGVSNKMWFVFMLGISNSQDLVNIGIENSGTAQVGAREGATLVQFAAKNIQEGIKMCHSFFVKQGNVL